ncbi:hypothetical protein H5410_061851 [Solanum commersonii]|uniref:Uncharacterized protein n=1 Tax=Solanum commersonii TaxID=4109 RepID=A0A9J5W918_SOLCO|nr:hypothetical protein H5410_061851 [Solanum commersonii]
MQECLLEKSLLELKPHKVKNSGNPSALSVMSSHNPKGDKHSMVMKKSKISHKKGNWVSVIRYEKKYTEEAEAEIKSVEKAQVESEKEVSLAGTISKPVAEATAQKNNKATSSTSDQDLDVFLLGEDSDDGPDDGDDAFDDDFDKIYIVEKVGRGGFGCTTVPGLLQLCVFVSLNLALCVCIFELSLCDMGASMPMHIWRH